MRLWKLSLITACALAFFASMSLADESPSASTPSVVSSTTNAKGATVTTYSDGSKLFETASFSECPDGWVCLWEDKEYSGRMLQFQTRGEWQSLLNPWNFNDKTTAWRNRTNDDAKLAQNVDGSGTWICLQPNSSNSQLTGFNDEASAIKIFKTATVC